MVYNRDITIDILRGLAVFTMVAANLADSPVLAQNYPLWLGLYSRFAPALFIFPPMQFLAL